KPDPAIFRVALDALAAAPETTVLIGDSLRRDGEGARRTGMRFIWLMSAGSRAPEASQAPQPLFRHAIAGLGALLGILQCLAPALSLLGGRGSLGLGRGPVSARTGIASASRWYRLRGAR